MHKKYLRAVLFLVFGLCFLTSDSNGMMDDLIKELPNMTCPYNKHHQFRIDGSQVRCYSTENHQIVVCYGFGEARQASRFRIVEEENKKIQEPTRENGYHTIYMKGNRRHHLIKSRINDTYQGAELGNGLTEALIIKNGTPKYLYSELLGYDYNGHLYSFMKEPETSYSSGSYTTNTSTTNVRGNSSGATFHTSADGYTTVDNGRGGYWTISPSGHDID